MPASMRWLLTLFVLAIAAAIASGATIYYQSTTRATVMAEANGGHVEAGRTAIAALGCGACHVIPGIAGAQGRVGPSLQGIAKRAEIAGYLANDPDSMARWLMHPQTVAPGNGMPDQGVTPAEARDMTAYLRTLK